MGIEVHASCDASVRIPLEYQSPLPVHTNGMPVGEGTSQYFKVIAGWHPEILVSRRIVEKL